MMNFKGKALMAAVVLGLGGHAMAVTTSVDPGPVGSVITGYSTGDIALPGPNSEDVIIHFDDMKHLEFTPGARLRMIIKAFGGPVGGGNYSSTVTWGLLDESDVPILSDMFTDTIATVFHGRRVDVDSALIAHGFFLDFEPDVGPIDPMARVEFLYEGDVTVGEWTAAVPEPITATLGLMGFGVLGMATRRRSA